MRWKPELAEQRQQNLFGEVVFAALIQVSGGRSALLFDGCERAVRVGLQRGDDAGAGVTQVAVPVVGVEGSKPSPGEHLVELLERVVSVWAFVQGVAGTHQMVDQAAEDLRRVGRPVVRLGQHRVEHVGDPPVPSRAVMDPVGVELAEELGDVAAGPVREVLRIFAGGRLVGAEVAAHEVSECLAVAPPESHRVGGTNRRSPRRADGFDDAAPPSTATEMDHDESSPASGCCRLVAR